MPRNLFGLRDIVKNFLFLNKNNRKAKVVSLQRNNIVRSVHQFKININLLLKMTFTTTSLKHFNTNFETITATSTFHIASAPSEKLNPWL